MSHHITAHDFSHYLHELLVAKAAQQLEPVRLLVAEYQGILANFSHLQSEVDKLLHIQTGRDYEQIAQALKQGLQGLEKLATALAKAQEDYALSVVEADDVASLAELFSTRIANQILQKTIAAKRKEQERLVKRLTEKTANKSTDDSEKSTQKKRKVTDSSPVKLEYTEDSDNKKLVNAEHRFTGWQKIGKAGEVLAVTSPYWAAVIEQQTQLMWAVNWLGEEKFPNRGELTWFNPDSANNGGDAGHKNEGKNTHDWLAQVNKIGWCGFYDWRLPTLSELKNLLTNEISQYYHIREDVFSDMQSLGSRFWTSSTDQANKDYAWAMYFGYGHDGLAHKSYTLNVRLVRSVG